MAEQSYDPNDFLPTAFQQIDTATGRSTTNALKASRLKLSLTTKLKPVPSPDSEDLLAHRVCTDHMIVACWTTQHGWDDPEMVPFAPISLSPTASVLHYSTSCFEGLKVHRGFDDKLRLFRPEYNCARMVASARRVCLPEFNPEELLSLIKKLCEVDGPKWLPKGRHGESLYIRPTLIGSDSSLGFQVPGEALLVILLSYWPASTGPSKGLRLPCSDEDAVRSWPGGTGSAKISGNYAPSLPMQGEARRRGFDQVLWLFGSEGYITEAGSANFFTIWRNYEGKLQLVTPPLTDHLILAGVTRQSILDLAMERFVETARSNYGCEPLEVLEIMLTVSDLQNASRDGSLLSAFVVGTACFMQPVVHVQYGEAGINIPEESVPHVSMMRQWMKDIMFGYEENTWACEVTDE
ncbi:Aminotransferase class IV [Penicillium cataractarum]|uniref:Branched-chain-amino-acid aminotransferase n=1 Tax=Penicillium cataractarum TaxID=2100454 RepID=A0A9W9R7X1_9EURO|nr:Aminotransferase class IV [Penicillium cataractarum]KAJ5355340.1 Aminotransferase class IV [Penicillium cataractarum]